FPAVGGVIAIKRPDNLIGWALLLAGTAGLIGELLAKYADLALFVDPEADWPGGVAAFTIFSGSWTALLTGVFLLLLLFPNGVLPSRRWRIPAIVVPVFFAIV